MSTPETVDHAERAFDSKIEERVPGIVLVFAAGKPAGLVTWRATKTPVEIGREHSRLLADEATLSRTHARVSWSRSGWTVEDLESRNGSWLDGKQLGNQTVPVDSTHVLRLGAALFLLTPDVPSTASDPESSVELVDGVVRSHGLREQWRAIERAARSGAALHVSGETGTGKEIAARAFHRLAHGEKKPFVAVNCATISAAIAERLLFGAVRGAFTGAESAVGFAESARGGTLFLDEVDELDLAVQAKLLRLLETHELYPVGSTEARRVDFTLVTASHDDLAAQVDAGRFRADLYYRIARYRVPLPALHERREEIPWLAYQVVRSLDAELSLGTSFVEECLLRTWPGNIRQLMTETELAVHLAKEREESVLVRDHLPKERESQRSVVEELTTADIENALRENHGNVTAAARALGLHRNQLRRRLERENIDPSAFAK